METTGQRLTNSRSKPMVFQTTHNDCIVCTSHRYSSDGYLKKRWGSSKNEVPYQFHRYIFQCVNGEISDDYEVDHICRNKACVNPKHLQALTKAEHRSKSSKERASDIRDNAKFVWEQLGRPKPYQLVDVFGYTIYRWIREWKKELTDVHKEKEIPNRVHRVD